MELSRELQFTADTEKSLIIDRLGTKLGEVFLLIRKILSEDKSARVIVFTTVCGSTDK